MRVSVDKSDVKVVLWEGVAPEEKVYMNAIIMEDLSFFK